jgi:2'-5' RNA ligase
MNAKSEHILFFIAAVPPQPLFDELNELRKSIAARYQATKALRIVPHITLKAPFKLHFSLYEQWLEAFQSLSFSVQPFDVMFEKFNAFKKRKSPVLFLEPLYTESLFQLQKDLLRQLKALPFMIEFSSNEYEFHPHLTMAYRDLTYDNFHVLWNEVKNQTFERSFRLEELSLLEHDSQKWNITQRIQL